MSIPIKKQPLNEWITNFATSTFRVIFTEKSHPLSLSLFRNRPATTTTTEAPFSRRRGGFRPSGQSAGSPPKQSTKSKSSDQQPLPTVSLPVPKVKLPRTQGRWSYKTTPKPRVVIRKQVDEEDALRPLSTEASTTESSFVTSFVDEQGKIPVAIATVANSAASPGAVSVAQRKELSLTEDELDPSESEDISVSVQEQQQHAGEQILPVETLNVEISTAADLDSIYFEIATIKSPYSFQVIFLHSISMITRLTSRCQVWKYSISSARESIEHFSRAHGHRVIQYSSFFLGRNVAKHPLHHTDFHHKKDLRDGRAEQLDLAHRTADGEHPGEHRGRLRIDSAARLICRDATGDLAGRRPGDAAVGDADGNVLDDADTAEDASLAGDLRRQQHHPADPGADVQHRPSGDSDEDTAANGDLSVYPQQDAERVQLEARRGRQRAASRARFRGRRSRRWGRAQEGGGSFEWSRFGLGYLQVGVTVQGQEWCSDQQQQQQRRASDHAGTGAAIGSAEVLRSTAAASHHHVQAGDHPGDAVRVACNSHSELGKHHLFYAIQAGGHRAQVSILFIFDKLRW